MSRLSKKERKQIFIAITIIVVIVNTLVIFSFFRHSSSEKTTHNTLSDSTLLIENTTNITEQPSDSIRPQKRREKDGRGRTINPFEDKLKEKK